jgi:hypothetical protein
MSAQIVPERQPLPHLSMQFRHVHMVGALLSKGWHAFDEEHSILLRIIVLTDIIKFSKGFDKDGLRIGQ